MTFSLIGRCERTGMFGIAISTSEMAVGSRCIHVAPGVGAVVTQASTNPRLGHLGLNLLRAGYSAPRVLDEIAASDQFVERRQLGCLDLTGLSAARTGKDNKPWAGHRADRNVVVAANMVRRDSSICCAERLPKPLPSSSIPVLRSKCAGNGMTAPLIDPICTKRMRGSPAGEP